MSRKIQFGVAISEEELGRTAPVPLQGGLVEGIGRAGSLGFDAVEIHIRNPSDIDFSAVSEASDRYGVRIAAVGTGLEATLNGLLLTSDDPDIRRRSAARMKEHIDVAAQFGSTVFIGLCRGRADDPSRREELAARLGDELVPLARYASDRRVTLSVEPIASYMTNLLNSTEETLRFLDHTEAKGLLLLLDTHHMHFEDDDIPSAIRMSRGRIGHVHISDSDRRYPGSGEIDYDAVAHALDDIDYDGAVSLEVLPEPDGETAARFGLAWMRSRWSD